MNKFIMTASLIALSSSSFACDGVWIKPGDGDWSNPANWTCVPSAPGDNAHFNTLAPSNITVNVDGSFPISNIFFNSTTTSYALLNPSTSVGITLSNPNSSIDVLGHHDILGNMLLEHTNVDIDTHGSSNSLTFLNANINEFDFNLPHSNVNIHGVGTINLRATNNTIVNSACVFFPSGNATMTGGNLNVENFGRVRSSILNTGVTFIAGSLLELIGVNLNCSNTGDVGLYNTDPFNFGSSLACVLGGNLNLLNCTSTLTNSGKVRRGYGAIIASVGATINIVDGTLSVINNTPQTAPADATVRIAGCGLGSGFGSQLNVDAAQISLINRRNVSGGSASGQGVFGCIVDVIGIAITSGGSMNLNNEGIVAQPILGSVTNGGCAITASSNVTIDNGYIASNDIIGTPTLTINDQGILASSGFFYGLPLNTATSLTNNGAVIPGYNTTGIPGPAVTTPGVMKVNGNYIQNATGDLVINIENLFSFSQINISGTAALNGKVIVAFTSDANVSPADTFVILTAEGGRTGVFDDIISFNLPPQFFPQISYEENQVILSFETSDLCPNF